MTPDQLVSDCDGKARKMRASADIARECGMPGSAPTFEQEAEWYESIAALLREREALRAALQRLHDLGEWKLRHGIWESDEEVQDAYGQACALLTGTTARTEGK